MNTIPYAVVGLYIGDAIAQAYSQFETIPNVHVLPKRPYFFEYIQKKTFSICQHFKRLPKLIASSMISHICDRDIKRMNLVRGHSYNFIFLESEKALSQEYLCHIKRVFPQSNCVLVLLNTTDEYPSFKNRISLVHDYYDMIVTCNETDAKNEGWSYHPDCYTPSPDVELTKKTSIDLLFVAADKGRAKLAREIFQYLTNKGVKCEFLIIGQDGSKVRNPNFKFINKQISYAEYLAKVSESRCLLEIVFGDQNYCTLRTMESVVYHKKLISNNRNLINESFYDHDNMLVFSTATDISYEFIRTAFAEKIVETSFLPEHLLTFIQKGLNSKSTNQAHSQPDAS